MLTEKNISYPQIASTKSLDEVARGDSHVRVYAQEVFQKSAQLVACQLAAIAAFRKSDLVCVMEGSVFWKGYQYKEVVSQTLNELSPAYHISFLHVEDSSVMGAAKLIA